MPQGLLFAIGPVIGSDILLQTPSGEGSLFFGQPGCRSREVGENEEGCKGDGDGDDTFDQEQPAPRPPA